MTHLEITKLIHDDLDSRGLKNPSIRKNALKKVLEYMKRSDVFIQNNSIVLQCDKEEFKQHLTRIKGYDLNSAESSVINMIYSYVGNTSIGNKSSIPSMSAFNHHIISKATQLASMQEILPDKDLEEIEDELIKTEFLRVDDLKNGMVIPDRPGLYCIKLCSGISFPPEFGQIREDGIIYIGQASVSLRDRLWEQELNHNKAATFFRSIGAVLGYLPPKGSLANKRNKKNYRFSEADTEKIKAWMRSSLKVSFLNVSNSELDNAEKFLIQKYRPLLNIKNNPTPNFALKEARKRCVEWAGGES